MVWGAVCTYIMKHMSKNNQNVADLMTKLDAQSVVSALMGLGLGVAVISVFPAPHMLLAWFMLLMPASLFMTYLSLRALHLPALNHNQVRLLLRCALPVRGAWATTANLPTSNISPLSHAALASQVTSSAVPTSTGVTRVDQCHALPIATATVSSNTPLSSATSTSGLLNGEQQAAIARAGVSLPPELARAVERHHRVAQWCKQVDTALIATIAARLPSPAELHERQRLFGEWHLELKPITAAKAVSSSPPSTHSVTPALAAAAAPTNAISSAVTSSFFSTSSMRSLAARYGSIKLGVAIDRVFVTENQLQASLDILRREGYLLWVSHGLLRPEVSVLFHEDMGPRDAFRGLFHAVSVLHQLEAQVLVYIQT
jgi:hypothetical protein